MATALFTGHLQPIVPAIYVILSCVTFTAYLIDKMAAEQGKRRISETTLHGLAFLGGWPGAYAAQRILRHKTVKQPFQLVFILCVALNILALILIGLRMPL